jgi:hypothetical protein
MQWQDLPREIAAIGVIFLLTYAVAGLAGLSAAAQRAQVLG